MAQAAGGIARCHGCPSGCGAALECEASLPQEARAGGQGRGPGQGARARGQGRRPGQCARAGGQGSAPGQEARALRHQWRAPGRHFDHVAPPVPRRRRWREPSQQATPQANCCRR
eukprot:scaffold98376_cov42-Phaeocystis_antarctica.AAC.1